MTFFSSFFLFLFKWEIAKLEVDKCDSGEMGNGKWQNGILPGKCKLRNQTIES